MAEREPIVDVDIHTYPASAGTLETYLDDSIPNDLFFGGGTGYVFPRSAQRLDAIPPNGVAGSDAEFLSENHFDKHGITYGVLTPATAVGFAKNPNVDLAAEMARATNDWTIDYWLPRDERFLGSIAVATADPERAADEIRRVGSNPRMVQVYAASPPCLLGDPFLHPIYEACDELGLPFTLHVGGGDIGLSLGNKHGIGYATTYCEVHISMCIPAIGHLISIVAEGVFEKYPRMRLLISECGTAWLPFVMWRMDMEYLAAREDVPWLRRKPSEYIRESVRFSTQPLEEPENGKDIITLLSLVHGDELLVFSSDYPHFDADDPEIIRRRLPAEWRERIFAKNAFELYRLGDRVGALAVP